ncbi:biopolymer transporter ExbD [bacterium]|nr:biopolymer transporter ExbD [FCB group bacterium]MBL7191381.1 biopolymer transporter ExbD [bacterium]
MKFKAKNKAGAEIPQASLPDIIFMLLMFFMVCTVFKEYQGLPIIPPAARSTEKIETKRNITYVWADRNNRISIDDKIITIKNISAIIGEKFAANRRLIVSMKIDKETKMGLVNDIQEQLRDAYALRISYATRFK